MSLATEIELLCQLLPQQPNHEWAPVEDDHCGRVCQLVWVQNHLIDQNRWAYDLFPELCQMTDVIRRIQTINDTSCSRPQATQRISEYLVGVVAKGIK